MFLPRSLHLPLCIQSLVHDVADYLVLRYLKICYATFSFSCLSRRMGASYCRTGLPPDNK